MRASIRFVALFAAAATALGLGACSSAADSSQRGGNGNGPITIGIALPLSGPLKASAGPYLAVVSHLGKGLPGTKTIDGRKVKIDLVDSKGTSAGGASATRQLVFQDNVDAVIGPLYTEAAEASLPVTSKAKVFQITLSGCPICGDPSKYPYSFSVEADRPTQMPPTVDRMKELGVKTVAVLVEDNASGQSYANAFITEAKKQGIEIARSVHYASDALDLASQVSKLQRSGADAVYITSAVPVRIARVAKAMDAADYHPMLFGNVALSSEDAIKGVDPTWLEKWNSSGYGKHATRPDPPKQTVQYRNTLNQLLGKKPLPDQINLYCTPRDAFDMIKGAIEGTHSTNAKKMTDWLVSHDWKNGLKAAYEFTETEHNGETSASQAVIKAGTMKNGFPLRAGASQ